MMTGKSLTLDKRTRSLEVRGFLLEDLDELKAHFAVSDGTKSTAAFLDFTAIVYVPDSTAVCKIMQLLYIVPVFVLEPVKITLSQRQCLDSCSCCGM